MFAAKILFLCCIVLCLTEARPFLRNIIASSLIPDSSNVEDLRQNKPEKLREQEPLDHNEAVPSLLQKKVQKILRKLQLITRFVSPKDEAEGEAAKDSDFDFDFDEDSGNENATQPVALKLEDEVNKYDLSPGGIGIYFVELFGSLMGLIYGAAIQLVGGSNN